ncbi:MAG: hypothetical protein KGI19_09030 [Thaumarchaeota archaeon]|nr:hypothetical protein [Nitrososphaerota archaeon]
MSKVYDSLVNPTTKKSIMIVSVLVTLCGIIYFVTSYTQSLEGADTASQIQTMFFATVGIVYIPLGIWMLKNRLHSRAPYVISILISIFLIILYIASRNISLPIVGIQTDIGMIDLATKTIQVGIIAISAILLRNLKREQIIPGSQQYVR